jgi:hypothetical protein
MKLLLPLIDIVQAAASEELPNAKSISSLFFASFAELGESVLAVFSSPC